MEGDLNMIEVVFEESTKHAMRMAKAYGNKKNIEGSMKDVFYIGNFLDIGDISGDIDSTPRKEVFNKLWSDIYHNDKELEEYFYNEYKDLDRLLSAAKANRDIRIWKSNSPHSACAFAFVCYNLKDIDCKISLVSLPERHKISKDMIQSYTTWQEIVPENLNKFLSFERELSNIEKEIEADLWKDLKEENAPLRAIVNGRLISVPENFYDHLIIKNISDKEFTVGHLIGGILTKYQLGVTDVWYALRIKKMVEKDKLSIVSYENPSHHYGTVLKKANL